MLINTLKILILSSTVSLFSITHFTQFLIWRILLNISREYHHQKVKILLNWYQKQYGFLSFSLPLSLRGNNFNACSDFLPYFLTIFIFIHGNLMQKEQRVTIVAYFHVSTYKQKRKRFHAYNLRANVKFRPQERKRDILIVRVCFISCENVGEICIYDIILF